MNLNKVMLIGRLGKDPETKSIKEDLTVSNFSLATTKSFKQNNEWKETTQWHNIVAWNSKVCDKLQKGNLVYIEGEIETRSYDDKDGNKKYVTEIVARQIKALEKLGAQESSQSMSDDLPDFN